MEKSSELVERKESLKSNLDALDQKLTKIKELAKFSEAVNSKIAKPFYGTEKEDAPEGKKEVSNKSIPELFTDGLNQIDEQIDRIGSSLESISNLID